MQTAISTPKTPRAILLIGPPGARKTSLVLTFPKLAIAECDQNLAGPDRALRKSNPTLSYKYQSITLKEDGSAVELHLCYDRVLDFLADVKKDPEVDWVCVDNLTSINEFIIQKTMKAQNISYMEARNWATFKTDAINLIFTKARHLGKNVIFIAHEQEQVRNDPKNIMVQITTGYEPYIQSGVRDMLGGFFSDVWRLEANLAPGDKIETVLTTDKVGLMKQLKNSVGLPHTIKNPDYTMLSKLSGGLL